MKNKEEDGFALIAVLAIMLILSVVALGIHQSALSSLGAYSRQQQLIEQKYLAEATIEKLQFELIRQPRKRQSIFGPHVVMVFDVAMKVMIKNEDLHLNINRAEEKPMVDFFEKQGLRQQVARVLAARIIDWRDADNLKRPNGGEAIDYAFGEVRPRNSSFESVGELKLLLSRDVGVKYMKNITVYSFSDGVLQANESGMLAVNSGRSFGHYNFTVSNLTSKRENTFIFRGSLFGNSPMKRVR